MDRFVRCCFLRRTGDDCPLRAGSGIPSEWKFATFAARNARASLVRTGPTRSRRHECRPGGGRKRGAGREHDGDGGGSRWQASRIRSWWWMRSLRPRSARSLGGDGPRPLWFRSVLGEDCRGGWIRHRPVCLSGSRQLSVAEWSAVEVSCGRSAPSAIAARSRISASSVSPTTFFSPGRVRRHQLRRTR
ncbi:MAG: hypothetical protein JWL93_2430 [Hyphomicrobiales bacterium]|nr:hypothetical protein [Hyphomicrobiales bacterium]